MNLNEVSCWESNVKRPVEVNRTRSPKVIHMGLVFHFPIRSRFIHLLRRLSISSEQYFHLLITSEQSKTTFVIWLITCMHMNHFIFIFNRRWSITYMEVFYNFFFFDNPGVPRFAGHSPGPGQAAVHFTREGFTWAGSNPIPLWCPEEAW